MLRIALVKCKIKEAKMGGTPKKNNKRKKNRTVFAPPKKSGLGIKKKKKEKIQFLFPSERSAKTELACN